MDRGRVVTKVFERKAEEKEKEWEDLD